MAHRGRGLFIVIVFYPSALTDFDFFRNFYINFFSDPEFVG